MVFNNTVALNGENVTDTWDTNFVSVMHMNATPSEGDAFYDSTVYNNHGYFDGYWGAVSSATTEMGDIGYCVNLTEDASINITDHASLYFGDSGYTIQIWMRRYALPGNNKYILSK